MQSPRSILLHLDNSNNAAARLKAGRQLGDAFNAQVEVAYCVTPALQRLPMALEGAGIAAAMLAEIDDAGIARGRANFDAACEGSSRLAWVDPHAIAPWSFAARALYADLTLLAQRDAADPAAVELPPEFVAGVVVDSGRPALVLPSAFAGDAAAIGHTVLVAWKETRESARALTAALPWLRRAKAVHVATFGDDAEAPLRAVARHLRNHGIGITPHAGGGADATAGDDLLSRAADIGADLLVMGCFGHSRAREWVLGGATRSVLRSMTLPVLMVH